MRRQSGNFLLQALLALTLIFTFMPFLAKKLAGRDIAAQMYAAKQSIETVHNAARLWLYDNKDRLKYEGHIYEGEDLVDMLNPYGLPLGFNPVTSIGQNIKFEVNKELPEDVVLCEDDPDDPDCVPYAEPVIDAKIRVFNNGSLKEYQVAELARMIGFFARPTGSDKLDLDVDVPVDVMYTDVVRRNEPDDSIGFLTELDMGDYDILRGKNLYADNGEFDSVLARDMHVTVNKEEDVGSLRAEHNLIFKRDNNDPDVPALALVGADIEARNGYFGTMGLNSSGSGPNLYVYSNAGTGGHVMVNGHFKNRARFYLGKKDNDVDWYINNTMDLGTGTLNITGPFNINNDMRWSCDNGILYDYQDKPYPDGWGIEVARIRPPVKLHFGVAACDTPAFDNGVDWVIDPGGTSIVSLSMSVTSKDNFRIISCPFGTKSYNYGTVSCANMMQRVHGSSYKYTGSLYEQIACSYLFWSMLEQRINHRLEKLSNKDYRLDNLDGSCNIYQ